MGQYKTLHAAKKKRFNEFFTPRETVEDFMTKIAQHIKNRSVWCLADGQESEFTKWFLANFEMVGLKKLLCTSKSQTHGFAIQKTAGEDVKMFDLTGDGDYMSDEVLELAKDYDVVITNPPFSDAVSLLHFLNNKHLDYAVILPFYNVAYTIGVADDLPHLHNLKTSEFFVEHPEDFPLAKPYSLDPSLGYTVNICQAMWITNFVAGKLPTFTKSDKTFAELQAKKIVDDVIGFDHDDMIEVSRCKCIPNDIPDTTLLLMPTSILRYDIEASGYEIAGGMKNSNDTLVSQNGMLMFGKMSIHKKSDGKMPWWRIII